MAFDNRLTMTISTPFPSLVAAGLIKYPTRPRYQGGRKCKLNQEQMMRLRQMKKEGANLRDIAKFFGISTTTAHYYLEGRR